MNNDEEQCDNFQHNILGFDDDLKPHNDSYPGFDDDEVNKLLQDDDLEDSLLNRAKRDRYESTDKVPPFDRFAGDAMNFAGEHNRQVQFVPPDYEHDPELYYAI